MSQQKSSPSLCRVLGLDDSKGLAFLLSSTTAGEGAWVLLLACEEQAPVVVVPVMATSQSIIIVSLKCISAVGK